MHRVFFLSFFYFPLFTRQHIIVVNYNKIVITHSAICSLFGTDRTMSHSLVTPIHKTKIYVGVDKNQTQYPARTSPLEEEVYHAFSYSVSIRRETGILIWIQRWHTSMIRVFIYSWHFCGFSTRCVFSYKRTFNGNAKWNIYRYVFFFYRHRGMHKESNTTDLSSWQR
jgi:hypothetical protein